MGVSTVTAARILKGQLQNRKGEESLLEMDKFPYVALAKVSPRGRTLAPAGWGPHAARSRAGGRHRPEPKLGHGRASGAGSRPTPGRRARARPRGNGGAGRGCPAVGSRDPPLPSPGAILLKKRLFLLNCKSRLPPFTPSLQGMLVRVQKLLAFLSLPKNGLKKG